MSSKIVRLFCLLVFLLAPEPALAIVNGVPDTDYECVGALLDIDSGSLLCTGTLIGASWVLTSATCANAAPDVFAMGPDWSVSTRVYPVDGSFVHMSFSEDPPMYDFALIHLTYPVAFEPACPYSNFVDPAPGSSVIHVGYGLTLYPSGDTTQRHRTTNTVAEVYPLMFTADTSVSGPCVGDTGGPAFDSTGQQVLGVISYGDEACSAFVVDGKVSVVASFIASTIDGFAETGVFGDGFEAGTTDRWSAAVP